MLLRNIVADGENRLIVNDGEVFIEMNEREDGSMDLDFRFADESITDAEAEEFSQLVYKLITESIGEEDGTNLTSEPSSE